MAVVFDFFWAIAEIDSGKKNRISWGIFEFRNGEYERVKLRSSNLNYGCGINIE